MSVSERNTKDIKHRPYEKSWEVKDQIELSRCAIGIRLSYRFIKELMKQLREVHVTLSGISLVLHNARGSIGLEVSPSGKEIKIGGFGDDVSFVVEGRADYEAHWDRVEIFIPDTPENRAKMLGFLKTSVGA